MSSITMGAAVRWRLRTLLAGSGSQVSPSPSLSLSLCACVRVCVCVCVCVCRGVAVLRTAHLYALLVWIAGLQQNWSVRPTVGADSWARGHAAAPSTLRMGPIYPQGGRETERGFAEGLHRGDTQRGFTEGVYRGDTQPARPADTAACGPQPAPAGRHLSSVGLGEGAHRAAAQSGYSAASPAASSGYDAYDGRPNDGGNGVLLGEFIASLDARTSVA